MTIEDKDINIMLFLYFVSYLFLKECSFIYFLLSPLLINEKKKHITGAINHTECQNEKKGHIISWSYLEDFAIVKITSQAKK